jgi:dihydroorotate dehydrogenase (NAD+) catalytic subunit
VVKSVTLEPRQGLPTPRMAETPSGMLNAIGLQNPGIDAWLTKDLPWLQSGRPGRGVDRRQRSVEDFGPWPRKSAGQPGGIAAIEVNLSCPNVEERGLVFACSPTDSAEVIARSARRPTSPCSRS